MDWLIYIASYPDLIAALGTDTAAAQRHYELYGKAEGRTLNGFDALQYGASNPDLAKQYGNDAHALALHYIQTGYAQGRPTTGFDALEYGASYPDLALAYAADATALRRHYLEYGAKEGRAPATFNALQYAALNPDVAANFGTNEASLRIHYLNYGVKEGRVTSGFDALEYGASNPDLAAQYGANTQALLTHYITVGRAQGRAVASFDALEYGASYADLARDYGTDVAALTRHYLLYGAKEGRSTDNFNALQYAAMNPSVAAQFGLNEAALRNHYLTVGVKQGLQTSGFDAVAYLLTNSDLRASGMTAADALKHWILYGAQEHRTATVFGDDQASHTLAVGRVTRGDLSSTGDKDWYSLQVTAGQSVAVSMLTPGGVGMLMPGSALDIYDSHGRLLGTKSVDGGVGFDNWLQVTAAESGTLYVVARSSGNFGAFDIAVAKYISNANYDVIGGAIADVMIGVESMYNYIDGGAGDDLLGGGAGQDTFVGGPGADFMDGRGWGGQNGVTYHLSPSAVEVHLDGTILGRGGWAEGDRLVNMNSLGGSPFDDHLYGSSGNDYINGGGGYDYIEGLGGQDMLMADDGGATLLGGAGDDYLYAGSGNDILDGGDGFDRADYQATDIGLRIDMRSGLMAGGAAGDTLISIEMLSGSRGADILANNTTGRMGLFGYTGDDILIDRTQSGQGAWLNGGAGNDLLIGASLEGDEGDDIFVATREGVINTASGRGGADKYVIDPLDNVLGTVFDFSLTLNSFDGSDVIDLSRLRDENGAVLDLADIVAHTNGNVIDLSGFHTAAGDLVTGYIELRQQAGYYDPTTPYDTAQLTGANFLFTNGVNWLGMLPADIPFH
jgi:hypothetical protein